MEIVALNEELRHEFSPVLKLLRPQAPPAPTPPPRSSEQKQSAARSKTSTSVKTTETDAIDPMPSAEAVGAQAPPSATPPTGASCTVAQPLEEKAAPQQLVRIDRFKQHCLTVAHRLNTYQYGTKQAFCQEIAQLLLVARTPEQQRELQVRTVRCTRTYTY